MVLKELSLSGPPAASAPIVLPWNEPEKLKISVLCDQFSELWKYLLAIFMLASIASVPELQKNT